MTFESKIWSIETISAKPIYALTQWQAFECRVGRSKGRSRHFIGAPGPDINPVISGAIVRFDPGTSCGATASDKIYQLGKEVGLAPAGERIWSLWKDANEATDIVNVTDDVTKLLGAMEDTLEVNPRTFESLGIHRAVQAMTNDEIRDLIREGEESGSTAQLRQHMDFAADYANNQNHGVLSQAALQRASARRKLAEVFLRDAQRIENSLRTRADLAFDAVYLCALASIGGSADDYEHPSPRALKGAARFLGLTSEQIQPAMAYARYRYQPAGTEAQCQVAYDELVTIATRLLKTK